MKLKSYFGNKLFDVVMDIKYVADMGMYSDNRFYKHRTGGVCFLNGDLDSVFAWHGFLKDLKSYEEFLFVLDIGKVDISRYELPYNVLYCKTDYRKLNKRYKPAGKMDYGCLWELRKSGYKVGVINIKGGFVSYENLDIVIMLSETWDGFPLRYIKPNIPVVGDSGFGRRRDVIYSSHDILKIYD